MRAAHDSELMFLRAQTEVHLDREYVYVRSNDASDNVYNVYKNEEIEK